MSALLENFSEAEAAELCRVIVLYDSAATREQALRFCDHLLEKFGAELEFEFDWWRTDFLAVSELARLSAAQAETADVFIVCTSPNRQLAPPVKQWFESWANHHTGHIGAMVDLIPVAAGQPGCAWVTHEFLREVSKIATLDFLEPAARPAFSSHAFPPAIWNETPAPEHYGLNE